MRIIDVEQGSQEWLNIRLGLISASRFKDIMTEPRSKADKEAGVLSDTAQAYMRELIAEIITGQQAEVSGRALEWGAENEAAARSEYEFWHNSVVEEIGICISDDYMTGASPDGFVGADGMIEIKCPYNTGNHVKTIITGEMPNEHMPQVQGNLWINGREWCDFISYDPRVSGESCIFVSRVYRDNDYIENLATKVENFRIQMCSVLKESFAVDWQGVTVEVE